MHARARVRARVPADVAWQPAPPEASQRPEAQRPEPRSNLRVTSPPNTILPGRHAAAYFYLPQKPLGKLLIVSQRAAPPTGSIL